MKKDVEAELRVIVGYSKCKRARRTVLDAYYEAFTIEYSELEAYADELLRSNPGSTVKVELCKDELSKGMRVLKRIFVCLDACKTSWKASCRHIISLDRCFLNNKLKGEFLVTLGRMGMNKIFLQHRVV